MYNSEKTALKIRYYAAKQGLSGKEIERRTQIGHGVFYKSRMWRTPRRG